MHETMRNQSIPFPVMNGTIRYEGQLPKQLMVAETNIGHDNRDPDNNISNHCLLYTSPSPRDYAASRMPSSA